MKKLFFMVCVLSTLLPVCKVAASGFTLNGTKVCAVDPDGGTDYFWYCGSQNIGCAGYDDDTGDTAVWLINAEDKFEQGTLVQGNPANNASDRHWAFYWEGYYFACCGGTTGDNGKSGKFVRYYDGVWLTTITQSIGGGTCTRYKNPCGTLFDANGEEVSGECDGPEVCPDDQLVGEIGGEPHCVCPTGEGFNGEYSSECVACETNRNTPNQGVDKNGVCVRCSATQFFKADKMKNGEICSGSDCCITKNEVPIVMHSSLAWCYRCNQEKGLWRRCLSGKLGDTSAGGTAQDFQKCGLPSGEQIPDDKKVVL